MAHAIKKKTFLSQSRRLHVAQSVEHSKQPAILENPSPIIGLGCGGRYVVLGVCDSSFIQFNTPSSTVIETDFG